MSFIKYFQNGKTGNFVTMYSLWSFVFLLLLLLGTVNVCKGQSDDDDDDDDDGDFCDSTAANECFNDVQDDVRFVFDPVNDFLQAHNESALKDLCSAWEDSLNCTSSIIDTTCQIEEGRLQFDAWNEGLKRVLEFLCAEEMINLKAIASSVRCWSILKFVQCTEQEAKLDTVSALLNTKLVGQECQFLEDTIMKCNSIASVPDCSTSFLMETNIKHAMVAFFDGVECVDQVPETLSSSNDKKSQGSGSVGTSFTPSGSAFQCLFLVIVLIIVH